MNAEASSCSKWTILTIGGISIVIPVCETASKPITARDFGAKGDGVTDDTDALRKAFASGRNLDLEGKKYLIDVNKPGALTYYGLIPSDNTIIEGKGAEIILKPNNLEFYSMVTLMHSKNVKIYDLKLTGDVRYHRGSTGEWGIGFMMLGCKNCELHRVKANKMWGDGFYVAGYEKETTEGGGIFDSLARANRRLGLCVISCKSFVVKDCNFEDGGTIKHTFPSYGIDFEPNTNTYDSIDGIKLINIKTKNNHDGGVLFVPGSLGYSADPNFNPKLYVYMEKFISQGDGNKVHWPSSALRFVEANTYENMYNGFVEIKGFDVTNLKGFFPFHWKRNNDSFITIKATGLKADGDIQADYLY